MQTSLRALSVAYWFLAITALLFTWSGSFLITADSGKVDVMGLVLGSIFAILLVAGALEAWSRKVQRTLLQKFFLVAPGVLLVLLVVYVAIRLF